MADELDFGNARADEVVSWAYRTYKRVALVAGFQAESGVLIDMACRVVAHPEVITLDTGRLPEETHVVMERFRERYPIRLQVVSPDAVEIERMTAEHGTMLFRQSVELRTHCCDVRKVRPLARALGSYDAWITGIRRDQSPARAATQVAAADPANGGITKIAPLAGWTRAQVAEYLRVRQVPLHPLYERGYTSIGCAPCTRPTTLGEDERAGRWWWERDAGKECGLHPDVVEAAG